MSRWLCSVFLWYILSYFFFPLHKSVISWVVEGIAVSDCSCTLAQDDREKKEGRRAQRKILPYFSQAKQARSGSVMRGTRREGEECKLSAEFWGSFEILLHNQPSFQVNSERSHSGLLQTTASEWETQHTHSGKHTHKGDILKKWFICLSTSSKPQDVVGQRAFD